MGRISATFKNSVELMAFAYAKENELSLSEAIEKLTTDAVSEFWRTLPRIKKQRYADAFEENQQQKTINK